MRAPSAIWQRGSIVGWVWLDRRGENEKRGAQESVPHGSLIERLSFAQGKVDKRRADSIFYCAVSRIASGVKFHLAAGTEPSLSNRTTIVLYHLVVFTGFCARLATRERLVSILFARPRSNMMRQILVDFLLEATRLSWTGKCMYVRSCSGCGLFLRLLAVLCEISHAFVALFLKRGK